MPTGYSLNLAMTDRFERSIPCGMVAFQATGLIHLPHVIKSQGT
jgi:hypothetical protein